MNCEAKIKNRFLTNYIFRKNKKKLEKTKNLLLNNLKNEFFFFALLQIAVRYAGVDIPGSPFLMTCNPNIDEVVNAAISDGPGSRKGSALTPAEELSYSKHGTGLQRGSIAEDVKGRLITSYESDFNY